MKGDGTTIADKCLGKQNISNLKLHSKDKNDISGLFWYVLPSPYFAIKNLLRAIEVGAKDFFSLLEGSLSER